MDSAQVLPGSIVVGIDGSAGADGALLWAADQAAHERRSLTVLHCVDPLGFPSAAAYPASGVDYGRLMADVQEAATTVLTTACARARERHPALDVRRLLSEADPRTALLDLGEKAAMVVVGSRGRGPVASLLLGSVSVSVSKHATCPVVVHRAPARPGARYGIVVGVDGTERSQPAIEFAYRMASWRSLPLTVLHASSVTGTGPAGAGPDSSAEEALVSESLAGMREKFPDVEVSVRLSAGFADDTLATASWNYDLLVIGHHPIPLLRDVVYGSVAPAVLEHAHGTVAVVPSALAPSAAPGA